MRTPTRRARCRGAPPPAWSRRARVATAACAAIALAAGAVACGGDEPDAEPAAIVIESPTPGEEVSSPLGVEGTADVFEATVELELVTADGEQLVSTFATASCGTGCRGDFSAELPYEGEGAATLRAFERSAKDGSETKVVEVPVQLR